jgi:hypothetical protein
MRSISATRPPTSVIVVVKGIGRSRKVGPGSHRQAGARRRAQVAPDLRRSRQRVSDALVGHEIRLAGDAQQFALAHSALDADVARELQAARLFSPDAGAQPIAFASACSRRRCRSSIRSPWQRTV